MNGQEVDVRSVSEGFAGDGAIPHAAALAGYAEAIVQRDATRTAATRETLRKALGAPGLVDAAATAAGFHGFVRLADAIGIPYLKAAFGQDLPDLRERAGITAFHRLQAQDE